MGKPFKIKHGLICAGKLLEVDNERDEVRIKGVIAATLDDLVGGGGTIGDINSLTTDDKSSIVGSINEVDSNVNTNSINIGVNSGNLAQEIIDRIHEDGQLDDKIDQEILDRGVTELAIAQHISNEETARITADGVIQTALNQEILDRGVAEGLIQGNLAQEILDRGNADTAIRNELGLDITNEATARSQIDTNLQIQINAIQGDINKYHLVDISSAYTHDFSNGNYIKVINSGSDYSNSLVMPENIANGGAKITIYNACSGYVKIDNFDNSPIQVLFPNQISELVFDNANTWIHSNDITSTTIAPIQNTSVINTSILPHNVLGKVDLVSDDLHFVNVSYNTDLSAWKMAINNVSNNLEVASKNISVGSSTANVFAKILDNNYFLSIDGRTIQLYNLNMGTLSSVGAAFSISGTLDISSVVVLKNDRFIVSTVSASERSFYLVGIDDFTSYTMSILDTEVITVSSANEFIDMFRYTDTKIGVVYSTTNFETKYYLTMNVVSDNFSISSTSSLTSNKCLKFSAVNENKFCYASNTNLLTMVLDSQGSATLQNSVLIDPSFGMNTNTNLSVILSNLNTKNRKRVGAIVQLSGTDYKFVNFYYSFEDDSFGPDFKGSESFVYNTNSTLLPSVACFIGSNLVISSIRSTASVAPLSFNEFVNFENYTSEFNQELIYVNNIEASGYIDVKKLKVSNDCEAEYFIGDGSKLTGIASGYDQSLNTTDSVNFNNITGSVFHGDGSQLTGIAAGYDQSCNSGDDVVFGSITATTFVGLPPGLKVYKTVCGEGSSTPTLIPDRTYTLPESGVGWQIGPASVLNATGSYGSEMGTSSQDILLVHPKGVPPFQVILHRNKNKGFPAGQGITDYSIAWKSNIANTAIRVDLFPEEEYEFWLQVVFL